MPDELVNVRYMVDDVEKAVDFYTAHCGFTVRSTHAPAFADNVRGNLRCCSTAPRARPDVQCPTAGSRSLELEPTPLHRR